MATLATLAGLACDREPVDVRLPPGSEAAADPIERTQTHMGTVFTITVADDNPQAGRAIEQAFTEIARVEQAISTWIEASDASRLNRHAGLGPLAVGEDLLAVARTGRDISELTGGAFDMTFAGCAHLWSTDPPRAPSTTELAACLPSISYEYIVIDEDTATIQLTRPDARIGLGGIGKGYGIDRAASVLRAHGLEDFLVEGGGDLLASGSRFGQPWRVGVQHPRGLRGQLLGEIDLPGDVTAVATSGDYERFAESGDGRIHHIIDPRTGGVAEGAVSVTLLAPDATRADALATGILVLGARDGLALVESLPDVEALIIDPALELHASSGLPSRLRLFGP